MMKIWMHCRLVRQHQTSFEFQLFFFCLTVSSTFFWCARRFLIAGRTKSPTLMALAGHYRATLSKSKTTTNFLTTKKQIKFNLPSFRIPILKHFFNLCYKSWRVSFFTKKNSNCFLNWSFDKKSWFVFCFSWARFERKNMLANQLFESLV